MAGKFVVITGPSASGKSTLVDMLVQSVPNSARLVTMTTRAPRLHEKEALDYFFISRDEFKKRLEKDEFFEHAEVYGNLYGSSKVILQEFLNTYAFVFAIIDVQGAQTLKEKIPEALVVFVRPGSIDDVKRRLESERMDVPQQEISTRMATVAEEIGLAHSFDAMIRNVQDHFDDTLQDMIKIVDTLK